jgi:nitroreductase
MRTRHSTRFFHPTPIPQPLLSSALHLAQNSPSNSNIQPWRLKILRGATLSHLATALTTAVTSGRTPTTEPLPDAYRHYRSALGKALYGPDGYDIPRSDAEGMERAQLRNYSFFGAPVGVVVCMDKGLAQVDVLSVGMYLQSLCLLLAERGVGTCVEASVAGYPDVVRETLGIGEEMLVLVGMAVGFEDERERVNGVRMERDEVGDTVEFFE